MRPTTYRHTTTRANLASILAEGLDPKRATGKKELVWLHTPARTVWAILHTQKRHGAVLADVVTLEVSIPRSWVVRAWRGLWTCDRHIPADRIRILETGEETASSPIGK